MSFSCHNGSVICYNYKGLRGFQHLTFNQVVRGSNPRCFIIEKRRKPCIYAGLRRFCIGKSKLF